MRAAEKRRGRPAAAPCNRLSILASAQDSQGPRGRQPDACVRHARQPAPSPCAACRRSPLPSPSPITAERASLRSARVGAPASHRPSLSPFASGALLAANGARAPRQASRCPAAGGHSGGQRAKALLAGEALRAGSGREPFAAHVGAPASRRASVSEFAGGRACCEALVPREGIGFPLLRPVTGEHPAGPIERRAGGGATRHRRIAGDARRIESTA